MVSRGVSWGLRYREEAARLHQRGAASLVGCDALQYGTTERRLAKGGRLYVKRSIPSQLRWVPFPPGRYRPQS